MSSFSLASTRAIAPKKKIAAATLGRKCAKNKSLGAKVVVVSNLQRVGKRISGERNDARLGRRDVIVQRRGGEFDGAAESAASR